MRTIIAGGRDYHFTDADRAWLDRVHAELPITVVLCGCARGADTDGETWATSRGIPVERYPANWSAYGRGAGHRRNAEMAAVADALIHFPGGRGTANMVARAQARGLVVVAGLGNLPASAVRAL